MTGAAPARSSVDVYVVRLSEARAGMERFEAVLTPEERQRSEKFLRREDRARYVAGRGLARWLLARELSAEPAALQICADGAGRPFLIQNGSSSALDFNVSHSGDVVLCASAWHRRVGVDVELVRDMPDAMDLARSQFAPEEIAALGTGSMAERSAAFIRMWTRKEAFLKARGDGLGFALNKFAVSAGAPPALLRVEGEPEADAKWALVDLDVARGYIASLALERPLVSVSLHHWNPGDFL